MVIVGINVIVIGLFARVGIFKNHRDKETINPYVMLGFRMTYL